MPPDIHMSDAGQPDLPGFADNASMLQEDPGVGSQSCSASSTTSYPSLSQTNTSLSPHDSVRKSQANVSSPNLVEQTTTADSFLWCKEEARNSSPNGKDCLSSDAAQSLREQQTYNSKSCLRFAPQIVATSKRSRKAGDEQPALSFSDKTDAILSTTVVTRHRLPNTQLPTQHSESSSYGSDVTTAEARRLGLPLRRQSVVTLDPLAPQRRVLAFTPTRSPLSSQTDLTTLNAPVSDHKLINRHPHINSTPQRFSRGLVALAARKAERQLHEQALAAFPNDDRIRDPVYHYMDQDETPPASVMASSVVSAYSSVSEFEIQSWHTENWELKAMRAHHEKLNAEREQHRTQPDVRRRVHKQLHVDALAIPAAIPEGRSTNQKRNNDARDGRPQVRAPMLGKDIEFPRSDSPDPARFDVTQGPESLKKAMCYLSEQSEMHANPESCGGLWIPKREPSTTAGSCTWSRPATRNPSNAGLWGGSCIDNNSPPRGATGIMTPRLEDEAPSLRKDSTSQFRQQLPPSPPMSSSGQAVMEERELSLTIQEEFDDSFITQVFNYMSLGYPAIARDFDEELGKVTGVAVTDLRKDDELPDAACGYIRLGEETAAVSGVTEQNCARWRALKQYVHEWARQHPKMAQLKPVEIGWTAARKGSWAW